MDSRTPTSLMRTKGQPSPQDLQFDDHVGIWLRPFDDEQTLVDELLRQMGSNSIHLGRLQYALVQEIEADDGDLLNRQMNWCDAQLYWIGATLKNAEALLDVAERFYKSPPGRSVPCTTEAGKLVPATGCKTADPESENFIPRYKEMTDHDREIELKAKCVPYRRWRDELQVVSNALEKRLYRGKDNLEELRSRERAAGAHASRKH